MVRAMIDRQPCPNCGSTTPGTYDDIALPVQMRPRSFVLAAGTQPEPLPCAMVRTIRCPDCRYPIAVPVGFDPTKPYR